MRTRTTLELDSELIETAMKLSGARTKTEVIEKALGELVRKHRIEKPSCRNERLVGVH